jgi:hypothetical protein
MKSCESCAEHRVVIGKNYGKVSVLRRAIGMIMIYLPILTLPFVIISAYLSYYHLIWMGAENVKQLKDFVPSRESHRYDLKSQITMEASFKTSTSQSRLFWILNCTWYCPVSVALFEWHAYLVKVVENWWCPFEHDKKATYDVAAIDKSFWHIHPEDIKKLHPDDLNNPIWNEEKAIK